MAADADVFAGIYQDGGWYEGSGPGSTAEATYPWREFLAGYLKAHQIRSVLDVGCGDWQTAALIDWTGIFYHGIDIVPAVIDANIEKHSGVGVLFECADITACELPDADLIIVKDVLQHWPDALIHEFGRRLGGRRALIVNDWLPGLVHADTRLGGYRPLDLARPPFGWPLTDMMMFGLPDFEGRIIWLKKVSELCGSSGTE